MEVAWGLSGAGHWMEASVEVMVKVKRELGARITSFLSAAGVEVARMYGVLKRLEECCEEVLTEEQLGKSCWRLGKLMLGGWGAVVISPASSNTVAKVVRGIADTPVTNLASLATKAGIARVILPSDTGRGDWTELPCTVERTLCEGCEAVCAAKDACPQGAMELVKGFPRINLLMCTACLRCVEACAQSAISFRKRVWVEGRKIDAKNLRRLKGMGFEVVKSPQELFEVLERILREGPRRHGEDR